MWIAKTNLTSHRTILSCICTVKLGKRTKMGGIAVHPFPHISSSTYTVRTISKQLKLVLKQKIHKETLAEFAVSESTVKKCYKEINRWFLLQWNSCNRFNRNHIDRRENNTTRHYTNSTRYLKRAFIKNPALWAMRQAWSAISRGQRRANKKNRTSGHPKWTREQWSSCLGFNRASIWSDEQNGRGRGKKWN